MLQFLENLTKTVRLTAFVYTGPASMAAVGGVLSGATHKTIKCHDALVYNIQVTPKIKLDTFR